MPLIPNCFYKTNEGKKCWVETLNFLKNQKPLHEYKLNEGLNWAANDHVSDLASNGLFGHTSSNGDDMTNRIEFRCGKFYGTWGENVGSAFNVEGVNFAQQTVLGLIIDDGVPNRGHRKAVFSADYKYIGSSSRVSKDKMITVINYHSDELKLKNKDQKVLKEKSTNVQQQPVVKTTTTTVSSKGEKKVVSQSTNTKTKTCNGKTTKTVVKKLKYSDGTEEEIIEESTY